MKAIETRRMRGQGGFTLIELLVVIAILAVLAGVVVFAVNGINNNSAETACKTEARTVKTAIQAFYAQETAYPTQYATAGTTKGLDGLLDSDPANIDITYIDADTEPTLAWKGKCTGRNCLDSSGAPIGTLPAQP
jgi:general secretion pathway protein G